MFEPVRSFTLCLALLMTGVAFLGVAGMASAPAGVPVASASIGGPPAFLLASQGGGAEGAGALCDALGSDALGKVKVGLVDPTGSAREAASGLGVIGPMPLDVCPLVERVLREVEDVRRCDSERYREVDAGVVRVTRTCGEGRSLIQFVLDTVDEVVREVDGVVQETEEVVQEVEEVLPAPAANTLPVDGIVSVDTLLGAEASVTPEDGIVFLADPSGGEAATGTLLEESWGPHVTADHEGI